MARRKTKAESIYICKVAIILYHGNLTIRLDKYKVLFMSI